MSEIEAAGDVVTGGLIARAVEPGAGEAGDTDETCANCGTALNGPYCHACGQRAQLHRSIGGIGHEIAHGVFHFEGKIWRTLPLLAFKPGELTRRYIHGERARFLSPMALFLFAVFLTFAVFETVGGPVRGNGATGWDVGAEVAKADAKVAALRTERAAIVKAGKPTEAVDRRMKAAIADQKGLRATQGYMSGDIVAPSEELGIQTGDAAADKRIAEAVKNPKLLLYKLQSNAYKFAWAIIVLSLPFMWLVFALRRDLKLYDHAIFVTYSLSATMLLLILMALVAATGIGTGWMLMLLPVHLFIQLRGAYGLRWPSALWRTMVLLVAAFIVLVTFAALLLVLGLLG